MQEELLNAPGTTKTNIPEFSVSDLAFSIKKSLEDSYGRVRIRGELSRVNIAGSGHMYTSLKDDKAVIDAVCWKGKMAKLGIKPEEGMEVICTGKLTTFPGSSKYQITIDTLELAGEGALLKLLEDRRKKLHAEGLFSPERKKQLPFLPQKIGVITSPTGAVIRDILHRLRDRFPRHVMVWPVLVQGQNAADQITKAIDGFNAMDPAQKPDLLIVARGGGSLEDLMAFNEENVVRATANSTIPIISAVGHETDTTLIDYAADLRAPTPTGAAEMAVPVRANLIAQILDNEHRLTASINRLISENRQRIQSASRGLGDPARLLELKTQSLDRLSDKITASFKHMLSNKSLKLTQTAAKLQTPTHQLATAKNTLNRWSEQLQTTKPNITQRKEEPLKHLEKMLEAYSFKNVLKRGFSVVRNSSGAVIETAAKAQKAENFEIQFQDDALRAQTSPSKPTKKKPTAKAPQGQDQQTLF